MKNKDDYEEDVEEREICKVCKRKVLKEDINFGVCFACEEEE